MAQKATDKTAETKQSNAAGRDAPPRQKRPPDASGTRQKGGNTQPTPPSNPTIDAVVDAATFAWIAVKWISDDKNQEIIEKGVIGVTKGAVGIKSLVDRRRSKEGRDGSGAEPSHGSASSTTDLCAMADRMGRLAGAEHHARHDAAGEPEPGLEEIKAQGRSLLTEVLVSLTTDEQDEVVAAFVAGYHAATRQTTESQGGMAGSERMSS